jgi:hypothetical protein
MKFKHITLIGLLAGSTFFGCTKLDQNLQDGFSQLPSNAGSVDVQGLLNATYNDMNGLLHAQDQLFSLQETTSDEALIPARGGDWDDNGIWRTLHTHTWDALHLYIKNVFNGLGKLQSDALSAAYNSGSDQEKRAQALFLRSFAQFYFLDLYGQVPYRKIEDYAGLEAASVLQPQEAIDTLVATLTSIIPQLSANNRPYSASPDAARFLLMKVLLNKAAFLYKATATVDSKPTFNDADMQQVIALGNEIINSGKYNLTANFFDNFGPENATLSTEEILAWPNNGSAGSAVQGRGNGGINARWMMTLHYNSWDQNNTYGSAGWNGFTTVADFYNTFDTADQRIGGRPYPGVTSASGLKPGLVIGQQYNEAGKPLTDRQGNPLAFTPDVKNIETDKNRLEIAGIRVVKYPPDYSGYSGGNQRNQLQIFRYADVLLMVAEAKMRLQAPDMAGALDIVNELRVKRGAAPLTSIVLVNDTNVADPNTLLAERGREMYFESWRRQDLIRFGVFLKPWALKDATADKDNSHLLFPISPDQLLANPNLTQNPGY